MSNGNFSIIGALGGALLGEVIGGPAGALKGFQVGETLGSIADALLYRPPPVGDSRFAYASEGSPRPMGWGKCRPACPLIWAARNTDGTYLTDHGGSGKGKTSGDHYWANFSFLIDDSVRYFPDGTWRERAKVIDRAWVNDLVVYQTQSFAAWNSSTTYASGDTVTGSDSQEYVSIGDDNQNHDPTTDNQSAPVWWKLLTQPFGYWGGLTFHPLPGESSTTMSVDSNMEGIDGQANTAAGRGSTLCSTGPQDLWGVGNAVPQSLSIEYHQVGPVQVLTITNATGGTFTISFSGSATSALAYNASASAVQAALRALPNCPSSLVVSGSNGGPWTCTFPQSGYPLMAANTGSLTGPSIKANVAESGSPMWSEFFEDIFRMCGMGLSDFNVSAISNLPMDGVLLDQRQAGMQAISQVLFLKAWDLVQIDGVETVVPRGGASALTIPDGDLSAALVESSDKLPPRLEGTVLADRQELHNRITIKFRDLNGNFRESAEVAIRNSVAFWNPTDLDAGLTLSRQEAAQMAGYAKDAEWLEQGGSWKARLPDIYASLTVSDVVTANDLLGNARRYRVAKENYVQGLLEIELVRDEPEILNRYELGTGTSGSTNTNSFVQTLFAVASPITDFSDQQATYPGFYVWANGPNGKGYNYRWPGCAVYYTFDAPGGTRNWSFAGNLTTASVFGKIVTTALANFFTANGFDSTSTTDLQMAIGAIMAAQQLNPFVVTQGNQWALIGPEIVGIVNVGAVSGNPAVQVVGGGLDGLYRCIRGSAGTGHSLGEQFAFAPSAAQTIKFPVDKSRIGQTCYIRCPTLPNQPIADAIEHSCVIQGNSLAYPNINFTTGGYATDIFAGDGSTTGFTLSNTPLSGSEMVFVDGVLQLLTTDYTLSSTTLTFGAAPINGSSIVVRYPHN